MQSKWRQRVLYCTWAGSPKRIAILATPYLLSTPFPPKRESGYTELTDDTPSAHLYRAVSEFGLKAGLSETQALITIRAVPLRITTAPRDVLDKPRGLLRQFLGMRIRATHVLGLIESRPKVTSLWIGLESHLCRCITPQSDFPGQSALRLVNSYSNPSSVLMWSNVLKFSIPWLEYFHAAHTVNSRPSG